MIVAPGCKETTADFDYDFCSYFASVFAGQNAKLEQKPVAVKFTPSVNVPDELSEFAKKNRPARQTQQEQYKKIFLYII